MTLDTQVNYSMNKVGRIACSAANKQGLRDISLGFYYGAWLGVRENHGVF